MGSRSGNDTTNAAAVKQTRPGTCVNQAALPGARLSGRTALGGSNRLASSERHARREHGILPAERLQLLDNSRPTVGRVSVQPLPAPPRSFRGAYGDELPVVPVLCGRLDAVRGRDECHPARDLHLAPRLPVGERICTRYARAMRSHCGRTPDAGRRLGCGARQVCRRWRPNAEPSARRMPGCV